MKYPTLTDLVVLPACSAKLLLMASVKIAIMQEKCQDLTDLAVTLVL